MRSHGGLFARLIDPAHLEAALARTVRGKRHRRDVAWFLLDRERHLARLQAALADGSWAPARGRALVVRDPKPRVIAVAPVLDRVAGNAIALLLEPLWLRSASPGDFACRRRFGTHRAVLRLLALQQRHRFVLHLDVRACFPSIRPDLVLGQLAARLRERPFVALLARILERGAGSYDAPWIRRLLHLGPDWPPRGRGLPMGSVTSQFFAAHVHFQGLDHWIDRTLKVPGYVRYVDDLFLFGDCRGELLDWRQAVRERLRHELDLRLKHERAPVLACAQQLDALGYRLHRTHLEPLPKTWRRLRQRLGAFVRGTGKVRTVDGLRQSLAGAAGHSRFG